MGSSCRLLLFWKSVKIFSSVFVSHMINPLTHETLVKWFISRMIWIVNFYSVLVLRNMAEMLGWIFIIISCRSLWPSMFFNSIRLCIFWVSPNSWWLHGQMPVVFMARFSEVSCWTQITQLVLHLSEDGIFKPSIFNYYTREIPLIWKYINRCTYIFQCVFICIYLEIWRKRGKKSPCLSVCYSVLLILAIDWEIHKYVGASLST